MGVHATVLLPWVCLAGQQYHLTITTAVTHLSQGIYELLWCYIRPVHEACSELICCCNRVLLLMVLSRPINAVSSGVEYESSLSQLRQVNRTPGNTQTEMMICEEEIRAGGAEK